MKKISYIYYLFILSMMLSISCMEDINEAVDPKYHNSADVLTYVEVNRKFLDTEPQSASMTISQIQKFEAPIRFVDIRSEAEYEAGHIEGAQLIPIEELADSLDPQNRKDFSRVVIVSQKGQKAAYAVALLRLYGIENIFWLYFGMGQWNSQFSEPWIAARDDSRFAYDYRVQDFRKPKLNKTLPSFDAEDDVDNAEELIKSRVRELLNEASYSESIINIDLLDNRYSNRHKVFEDTYIFCFGTLKLYLYTFINQDVAPPVVKGGHPRSAVLYTSIREFKSSTTLLTLPADKDIALYSANGQKASYLNAFLRLAGYNSFSIENGAVGMMYFHAHLDRLKDCFRERDIYDLPYVP